MEVPLHYNLGGRIFRLVGCSGIWDPVQLGSQYARRPNPTPDSNPNPNPDPKPQPKRVITGHKRGSTAFASNQEIFEWRTTIPEVPTTLLNFQVKNTPKDPTSQIAKPTPSEVARSALRR